MPGNYEWIVSLRAIDFQWFISSAFEQNMHLLFVCGRFTAKCPSVSAGLGVGRNQRWTTSGNAGRANARLQVVLSFSRAKLKQVPIETPGLGATATQRAGITMDLCFVGKSKSSWGGPQAAGDLTSAQSYRQQLQSSSRTSVQMPGGLSHWVFLPNEDQKTPKSIHGYSDRGEVLRGSSRH